ncbi:MAG: CDC48 family AAA ATPase [Chlamydiae bacterium]|nr:CDC48 family AAA ATPase [Chlamydiota bacterium]MBI3266494.1 CDC48 family AAA ATPase [Chlamydiota bacterium]
MASTVKKEQADSKSDSLTFRVAEALVRDVGRGIARLDPSDMEKLGCHVGDIIFIEGKHKTVAKLAPTYEEYRGKHYIQIDGVTRENAKIGLDGKVLVFATTAEPARTLWLKTTLSSSKQGALPSSDPYVGRLLEGLPVLKGDRVRATLFGSRTRDFEVVNTSPEGPLLITSSTQIKIEGEAVKGEEKTRPGVSYEDIGGLTREIQRIREMVELPLKHPEVFERLGIDPPKGVLLYGPPGTGKTLIARAVAHESEANFYTINGPEIVHKFYGESESHLRSIFEEARLHAPAIIFIDEIDSVAPKRANVQGEVEKRIVATLLSLLDGLKSRGELIVIGATNMPDLLDPALRRPGRFDREITIGIPDRNGRLKILEIHTRGMPLAEDVSLERIADITHGYVGADVEALAREAAMSCLRQVLEKRGMRIEDLPLEVIESLEVTQEHFTQALNEVEPSAIREVSLETPHVRWSDIGGLEAVKKLLIEGAEWPLHYAKVFEKANLKPNKGVLLIGAPGMGKTLLAKALATESEVNFISIKGPELVSKYVGETEKGVREIFKKARSAAPCVLFFDEMDSMAPRRGSGDGDSGVMGRTLSQFLTELDGTEELRGVIILGATNRVDLIDPALIRPGRFDHIIMLGPPDLKAREGIFQIHLKGTPVEKKVDKEALARETEGASGADIAALCRQAVTLAIREFIGEHQDKSNGLVEKFVVRKEHFQEAIQIARKAKK